MLELFGGLLSTVAENPAITLLIFLLMIVGLLFLFAGDDTGLAVNGLLRVLGTFFSTPFRFLKKVLEMMKRVDDLERPYVGTREHITYSANRLYYLFIFLTSVIFLSGGLAAGLLALYPKAEWELRKSLAGQLAESQNQIEIQKKVIEASASPNFRQSLEAQAATAKAARDVQAKAYQSASTGIGYNSTMLTSIGEATDIAAVDALKASMDEYFSECAEQWTDFTQDNCDELKGLSLRLADSRIELLKLDQVYQDARDRLQNESSAADDAKSQLADLEKENAQLTEQYDGASLWSVGWIWGHLKAAVSIVIPVILTVIAYVWSGAILADVLAWFIMMMLAAERRHSEAPSGTTEKEAADES